MFDTTAIDKIVYSKDSIIYVSHLVKASNDGNSQIQTNVVTIIIGLVAGLIALYQVKSNIISSARINWIENLREAISSYCVEISNCALIITNMVHETNGIDLSGGDTTTKIKEIIQKYYPDYIDASNKSDKLGNKVKLYLNASEPDHKNIEILIEEIYKHLHKDDMMQINKDMVEEKLSKIIFLSKSVFKKEWEKSKILFKI